MSDQAAPQAQPDRNADPKDALSEKTVAATDEFFKHLPPLPLQPKVAEEPSTLPVAEEIKIPSSEEGTGHSSIAPDYLRELKQEFEEQQEEGKIE